MERFSSIPIGGSGSLPSSSMPVTRGSLGRNDDLVQSDDDRIDRLIAKPFSERPKAKSDTSAVPVTTHTNADPHSLRIYTGKHFQRSGPRGLDRFLEHLAVKNPASFSGISHDDRKFLGDIIEQHAKNVSAGTEIGRLAKKAMRESVQTAVEQGQLSKSDRTKFDDIIDKLH